VHQRVQSDVADEAPREDPRAGGSKRIEYELHSSRRWGWFVSDLVAASQTQKRKRREREKSDAE